jgi:hypothetical protein
MYGHLAPILFNWKWEDDTLKVYWIRGTKAR